MLAMGRYSRNNKNYICQDVGQVNGITENLANKLQFALCMYLQQTPLIVSAQCFQRNE